MCKNTPTHTYEPMHAPPPPPLNTHKHTHTHTQSHTHKLMHECMHAREHTHTHKRAHTHTQCAYTGKNIHAHTYTLVCFPPPPPPNRHTQNTSEKRRIESSHLQCRIFGAQRSSVARKWTWNWCCGRHGRSWKTGRRSNYMQQYLPGLWMPARAELRQRASKADGTFL